MQSVSAVVPPSTGRTAFQTGLIFGAAQAVIACSILFINTYASPGLGLGLLLSVLSFLTGLAAYFCSGILAARQNGKVKTGTFAGMWTGAVYGVIGLIVSIGLFLQVTYPRLIDVAASSGLYTDNIEAYKTGAMIGGIGSAVFGVFFAIGLGAGLGALGGLVGRNMSPFKPLPAVQVYAVYPGQPAPYIPGQPVPIVPGQPYAPSQPVPYVPGSPVVSPPAPASEQVFPEQPANPFAVQSPLEEPQMEQQQSQQ
ncbi:MAG TPA: hypothetical protein VHD63_21600 [Ktedonobacteraceae bacterium]|nr:hypothetical protein [Ktedonobacteraceae bacterium]